MSDPLDKLVLDEDDMLGLYLNDKVVINKETGDIIFKQNLNSGEQVMAILLAAHVKHEYGISDSHKISMDEVEDMTTLNTATTLNMLKNRKEFIVKENDTFFIPKDQVQEVVSQLVRETLF